MCIRDRIGLPDIVEVHEITVQMMYVVCLVGFSPGFLEFWLTIRPHKLSNKVGEILLMFWSTIPALC